MYNKYLAELSKEQLLELIELYAKNWLAHDGVWFQSIERKSGMAEAMYHDEEVWKRFTVIEAKRIKEFLQLPENPGLEGLEQALHYRFYGNLNEHECIREGNRLVYRNCDCRVQTARSRKGMPYHPCKSVGIYEYSGFAATIDARIKCRCLSCFPDCTESPDGCAWEFYLEEELHEKYKEKGEDIMRIAVTYENGEIFQHFGHTEEFKVYDVQDGKVVASEVVDTNGQGHGALAGVLAALKADVLICGGIGGGAQMALAAAGIKLYGGVSGSADAAVEALLAGNLDYNPAVKCNHHGEHGEGHTCGEHGCGGHH